MLLIMKKNFIGKSILSIAAISLTVSTFAGESHAQTKNAETVKKYNEYQTNFKKQVNKKLWMHKSCKLVQTYKNCCNTP